MNRRSIAKYVFITLARTEKSFDRNGGFWSASGGRDVRMPEAPRSMLKKRVLELSAGLMLLFSRLDAALVVPAPDGFGYGGAGKRGRPD
jgi:hypothetical protein